VQLAAELAHEMPESDPPWAPDGSGGVAVSDHVPDLRVTASGDTSPVVASVETPTAVQLPPLSQETPERNLAPAPETVGVVSVVQVPVPPLRATTNASGPLLPTVVPTAVQFSEASQETPDSEVYAAGSGVVWIDHLPDDQRIASVCVPLRSLEEPTAVHALAEEHETPVNCAEVAPTGTGADCAVQLPVQRCAIGTAPEPAS